MILFWDAVSILEITCHLEVICATCDGASVNRTFFKCHEHMDDNLSQGDYYGWKGWKGWKSGIFHVCLSSYIFSSVSISHLILCTG